MIYYIIFGVLERWGRMCVDANLKFKTVIYQQRHDKQNVWVRVTIISLINLVAIGDWVKVFMGPIQYYMWWWWRSCLCLTLQCMKELG